MSRHVVLLKFTEKGLADVRNSPKRAEAFRATARKAGAKVETLLWTTGKYDGLVVLEAPDDTTAAGVVLGLAREGNVSTRTLRAFDADEFSEVLGKAT